MIKALRTPDDRFENLHDWQFAPNYVDSLSGYEGLQVHYVDEGPRDAETTFLCLHGQPAWSYLYRKMIPVFAGSGARVVAPDWLGFGRSDKPVDETVYRFSFHRSMMLRLIKHLDLSNVTLVCQDWGGVLGLTIPMELPERFSRLLVMNTTLAVGEMPSEGFAAWRSYNRSRHDLDIGALMLRSSSNLSEAEAKAYDAPFPDAAYKSGVRRFPELFMTEPDMEGADTSKRARDWWNNEWDGPTFMAVGMQDPVLGPPVMEQLRDTINGCPPPLEIPEGGHFVQEWGDEIAPAALAHWNSAS